MKKLILMSLVVWTSNCLAAGPEIVGPNDGKAIVGGIADVQVEEMLKNTSEFRKCREDNQFKANESPGQKNTRIQKAQACFEEALKDVKDPTRLQQLSESLNLQRYGLVRSKNVNDIQKYLNSKMYKSMTGVDPDEADRQKLVDSLKFGRKKEIDQAVFIRLYKTQLTKNALYEISRYCFLDLRKKGATETNFGEHWKGYTKGWLKSNVSSLTDDGKPVFTGAAISDPNNKNDIYKNIFESINLNGSNNIQMAQLEEFFLDCALTMVEMCSSFKDGLKGQAIKSETEAGTAGATPGAASCLAQARLEGFKKGLADASKIENLFKEISEKDSAGDHLLKAMGGTPIQLFVPGSDQNNSLDALTTYTTSDVLQGVENKDQSTEQAEQDCKQSGELDKCQGIVYDQEDFDKIKHNVEQEMIAKRESELARVRTLKNQDVAKLQDYLREIGMFKLADDIVSKKMSDSDIELEIKAAYDAKRTAALNELNTKLGSRQVKKSDTGPQNQSKIDLAIKDSKEERARIAQVVLFNNIITSQLELTREDGSKTRNVNAWRKEESDLKGSQINGSLFQNIQTTTGKGNTTVQGNEEIGGIGLIDKILGKK